MTTTIIKQQCLDLIDSLADKSLTFGQNVFHESRKKRVLSLWDGMEDKCIGGEHHQTNCDTLYMLEADPQNFEFEEEITNVSTGQWEYGTAPNPIKNQIKILGHDILIGGVLEAYSQMLERKPIEDKLAEAKAFAEKNLPRYAPASEDPNYIVNQVFKIALLWEECLDPKDARSKTGFKRPLQSIFEDIEWEVIAMNPTRADRSIAEVAKSSPATDLFIFLISLKLKK